MRTENHYPKTWPETAWGRQEINVDDGEPKLYIVKQVGEEVFEGHDRVSVLCMNDPANKGDRIRHVANFWRLKEAVDFCKNFSL